MAMHDEIREQQKKLKGKTFREKLGYFWDYYKVHTLVAIAVLVIGGGLIHDIVTAKEEAFSATLLNAYGGNMQHEFQDAFAEYAGIDTEIYDCYIDTSSTLNYNMTSEADLAIFQRTVAMEPFYHRLLPCQSGTGFPGLAGSPDRRGICEIRTLFLLFGRRPFGGP